MAYRNGTGPNGEGPITGKGLGSCTSKISTSNIQQLLRGTNILKRIGLGFGRFFNFGRGYGSRRLGNGRGLGRR